ncbi:hypothetical protein AcW1_006750 [Taiwanofungus camphoratus]|nr:hypothetical protein AcW2_005513 [Antrodia cinnamomea]KAI0955051.1 hypothetical protein AcW1_006750 [Antrodia cinnamomea]
MNGHEEEEQLSESDDDDDDGSADEYVADRTKAKAMGKRRTRRVSVSSDSESDSVQSTKGSRVQKQLHRTSAASRDVGVRTSSASPGPSGNPKRKPSAQAAPQPAAKRVRSESTPGDDPTRKYCSNKLQEVFCYIYLRYPFLRDEVPPQGAIGNDLQPDKKQEDVTDEEKEKLNGKAKQFAADLEQCMYEIYSEPDKTGKHAAAGKYKERFRMLSYNLSQPDRVSLHKRIASSHITPKQLSTMSSTDLANEEMKQSIRQAEQEALAHSILKKQTLPRAKITHKGIQDIEDVNGAAQRDLERKREEEEEERMERERLARLRVQAQRAQSASSQGQGSVPPDSPVVPQTQSWGAPPPVPMQSIQSNDPAVGMERPPLNPLFVPSASDYATSAEPELNLADLINIDEDITQDITPIGGPTPTPFGDESPSMLTEQKEKSAEEPSPSDTPHTPSAGISPFAARPDISSRPSFDLSSLWTPKGADPVFEQQSEVKVEKAEESTRDEEPREPPPVEMDIIGEEADDQDFDMFLGKDEDEKAPAQVEDNSPEAQRAAFEAIPKVWTGTLSMPLDSTMAQDVSLNARQTGGRTLGDPALWQTLFPSKELRIDGRVPVEKSALYLTQMRLASSKELIAVAFSPEPGSGIESIGFKTLIDHLIAKGRHGLVFPWGNRPKEHAPGREFYIIPLLSTDAIPDYMELLDDLRLPKLRNSNYLIGIWVLTRGKLAPPPAPPAPPPQPTMPAFNLSLLPQLSNSVPNLFTQSSSAAPLSPPANVSTATLAKEVAALTPEQIQQMLRQLSATAIVSLPQPTQQPPPQSSMPVPAQSSMPAIPLQPWLNPTPSFPSAFSPPASFPSAAQPLPPPRPFPDASYSRYEQDRPNPPPYDGGGERGRRGRVGGRGRGRSHDRHRDAGWPRSRGRGRGGASSPPRGRGWGEPPRWS